MRELYQDIPNLVLNVNILKLMLTGNERVYALEEGGRIFKSAENNIFSWAQIGTNSMPGNINQSSIVRYKSCLYFVIHSNALWKFDLTSKQASLVGTV